VNISRTHTHRLSFRISIMFDHNTMSTSSSILIFINVMIICIFIISLSIRSLHSCQECFSRKSYVKFKRHASTIRLFRDMPTMKYETLFLIFFNESIQHAVTSRVVRLSSCSNIIRRPMQHNIYCQYVHDDLFNTISNDLERMHPRIWCSEEYRI
jgi:hypothetical protein